jgi:D-alanyl-D-alanine-carboxypeptidase/D-alanyl-D-alanine-endopeptidase
MKHSLHVRPFPGVPLVAAALLSLSPSPGRAQAQTRAVTPAQPPLSLEQLVPRVDAHFRRFQEEAHAPGLVWGIVRDGQLLHVSAMGVQDLDARRPVDATSLFRIASMSKAFTALAILKLRDDGRLALDALAEEYVPEMRGWRYPTTDAPHIRVRDLLSHVGGLVTDDPWGDRQQILPEADFTRMLQEGVPFTRAPGTAYEYSNFGYALLGRIITNVSGRPYNEYIQQEIMRPLGMDATGYDVFASDQTKRALGYRWENDAFAREPDMAHGVFGAMGGVQTNAVEYARWVAFLLSAWPPRDGTEEGPVRRSSVRELAEGLNFASAGLRRGSFPGDCPQAVAYGKGMSVAMDCDLGLTLGHGGGYPGYGSYILLMPEHGIGLFAFSNRTYAGPSSTVWDAAVEVYRAGWLTERPVATSPELAQAYQAAGAMYQAGSLAPGRALLAMNFLMDRSEENWAKVFAGLKERTGACRTDAPIVPTGLLTGDFTWSCERAELRGELLLAPTNPPGIQALRFQMVPRR